MRHIWIQLQLLKNIYIYTKIIENIYSSVEKSVLHKLLLIQYILPIKPENISIIIHTEEKMNKNNLDFLNI